MAKRPKRKVLTEEERMNLLVEYSSMKPRRLIELLRKLKPREPRFVRRQKLENEVYVAQRLLCRLGWHYLHMELSMDVHEKNKPLKHYLQEVGFKIVALKANDYNLFDMVGIERKSGDLIGDIFNEKVFQQITEGLDEYDYFYFVVGRSYTDVQTELLRRKCHPNVLPGFVAACCKMGAPPLFINGPKNLADVIMYLAEKHYDGKPPRGSITTARVTFKTDRENRDIAALSILCPGLKPEAAERLIAFAGGLTEAIELIEDRWEKISDEDLRKHDLKGIFGPKRLKMVRDTLHKSRGRRK